MTERPTFTPVSAEFRGHVFENPRAGVPRGVYWTLTVDFAPIERDGAEWLVAMTVDWLTFAARRVAEIAIGSVGDLVRPDFVEASIYFADVHQSADVEALRIRHIGGATFDVSVAVTCELETLEGEQLPRSTIGWSGQLDLDGVSMVRENLFPKPSTPAEATAVLGAFLEPGDFEPPTLEASTFTFRPIGGRG